MKSDSIEVNFANQVQASIKNLGEDRDFLGLSNIWIREAIRHGYPGNFKWLGRPIIQIPQDIYAIQELVWEVNPDLIIETGIAHGGSLIMSASMLALLDYSEAVKSGSPIDPARTKRKVLGVDIDIRMHNKLAIEAHPLHNLVHMIQGSSISPQIADEVRDFAKNFKRVMVFLDSNHTHQHVLEELKIYAPMVTAGSYCVVWDTGVEDLPAGFVQDRPWGKGNNPKTAVWEYLTSLKAAEQGGAEVMQFEIDKGIENKLSITAAPDGFLRRTK